MTNITSKADLNRAVANIMCPKPPASERRAIHESGAWLWRRSCDCESCNEKYVGYWEPADFCCDPVASYSLEQAAVDQGMVPIMQIWRGEKAEWKVTLMISPIFGQCAPYAFHQSRLIAICLAVCAAHGVELELVEGWETR